MEYNRITSKILECAFAVHTALGPGLLESAYQECLYYELQQKALKVAKEQALPLVYKEVKLNAGYRIDLWVENAVVVEIKALEHITDVHIAQTLTYMKLSKSKIGLLLNFNVKSLKDGIKRLII
jgi:GxxExxY protein